MTTPKPGLYQKFKVDRIVGNDKPEEEFFVMSPSHDPIARMAINLYASIAERDGLTELANDLRDGLLRLAQGGRFYP